MKYYLKENRIEKIRKKFHIKFLIATLIGLLSAAYVLHTAGVQTYIIAISIIGTAILGLGIVFFFSRNMIKTLEKKYIEITDKSIIIKTAYDTKYLNFNDIKKVKIIKRKNTIRKIYIRTKRNILLNLSHEDSFNLIDELSKTIDSNLILYKKSDTNGLITSIVFFSIVLISIYIGFVRNIEEMKIISEYTIPFLGAIILLINREKSRMRKNTVFILSGLLVLWSSFSVYTGISELNEKHIIHSYNNKISTSIEFPVYPTKDISTKDGIEFISYQSNINNNYYSSTIIKNIEKSKNDFEIIQKDFMSNLASKNQWEIIEKRNINETIHFFIYSEEKDAFMRLNYLEKENLIFVWSVIGFTKKSLQRARAEQFLDSFTIK